MKIVVLVPPIRIIGEVKAGSSDEMVGKPMVLESPAAIVDRGPAGWLAVSLGGDLNFPASSPWPWSIPEAAEEEAYARISSKKSSLVVTNKMPKPTPIRS